MARFLPSSGVLRANWVSRTTVGRAAIAAWRPGTDASPRVRNDGREALENGPRSRKKRVGWSSSSSRGSLWKLAARSRFRDADSTAVFLAVTTNRETLALLLARSVT